VPCRPRQRQRSCFSTMFSVALISCNESMFFQQYVPFCSFTLHNTFSKLLFLTTRARRRSQSEIRKSRRILIKAIAKFTANWRNQCNVNMNVYSTVYFCWTVWWRHNCITLHVIKLRLRQVYHVWVECLTRPRPTAYLSAFYQTGCLQLSQKGIGVCLFQFLLGIFWQS